MFKPGRCWINPGGVNSTHWIPEGVSKHSNYNSFDFPSLCLLLLTASIDHCEHRDFPTQLILS